MNNEYKQLLDHRAGTEGIVHLLSGDIREERAKPIAQSALQQLPRGARKQLFYDTRVAYAKYLRRNDAVHVPTLDVKQIDPHLWTLECLGFEANLRILLDALQERIPLPAGADEDDDGELRKELYFEQSGCCNGCSHNYPPRNLEVDHVVPTARGGTDTDGNKQLLCGACNKSKSVRPMADFWRKLIAGKTVRGIPQTVPQRIRDLADGCESEE